MPSALCLPAREMHAVKAHFTDDLVSGGKGSLLILLDTGSREILRDAQNDTVSTRNDAFEQSQLITTRATRLPTSGGVL